MKHRMELVILVCLSLLHCSTAPLPNRVERAATPTLSGFLHRVSSLLRAFQRFTENHDLSQPQQLSDGSLQILEEMWGTLQASRSHFERLEPELPAHLHQPVMRDLQHILSYLRRIRESLQSTQGESDTNRQQSGQRVRSGNRGPPRYGIQQEQLHALLNMRMTLSAIARSGILGTTCRNTIINHCHRNNVKLPRQRFANVSDEALLDTVKDIHKDQPNSGAEEVRATLAASRNMVVQRERVRRALATVDPVGTASRWAQTTQRRRYSVISPNSLWHLDNNHALKRWRFYVHGGIDGFSRCIPFLLVTLENTAKIALMCFLKGIRKRGLPSRIRMDKGGEYNSCQRFMDWRMGPNRGSALRGQSVHNQRIERLWRDVFTKVLEKFYKLFYHLEDTGALNIQNPVHLFVLHYTYLPRIQNALTNWVTAHNNHGIRTEKFQTPEQLWVTNIIKQRCALQAGAGPRISVAVENVENFNLDNFTVEIMNRFDIDLTETQSDIVGTWRLTLPTLREEDIEELKRQIDPLRPSNVEGLDIYGEVLDFVFQILARRENGTAERQVNGGND